MSEQDKDQQAPAADPAAAPSEDGKPGQPPPRKPRQKSAFSRNLLALFALLIAASALALSVLHYQQNLQDVSSGREVAQQISQEVAPQLRQLRIELDRLESGLREQRSTLSDSARELRLRVAEIEDTQRALQRQLQTLSHSDRREWLLAEAEYLLRLANQRLLMGRDLQGATEMLRSADSILAGLGDSGLNNVREAIADEIAALRTADRFDPEGLYFQIRAAANRAAELRLYDMPAFEPELSETDAEQPPAERWFSGLADAFAKLGDYVRLERRDEAYSPLISPVQENSLRYSLSMLFEQAQLALLSGNQHLYEHTLQRSGDWIERYYVLDEKAANVVKVIEELRRQPVAAETPDISTSLRRLKQFIETVHRPQPHAGDDV